MQTQVPFLFPGSTPADAQPRLGAFGNSDSEAVSFESILLNLSGVPVKTKNGMPTSTIPLTNGFAGSSNKERELMLSLLAKQVDGPEFSDQLPGEVIPVVVPNLPNRVDETIPVSSLITTDGFPDFDWITLPGSDILLQNLVGNTVRKTSESKTANVLSSTPELLIDGQGTTVTTPVLPTRYSGHIAFSSADTVVSRNGDLATRLADSVSLDRNLPTKPDIIFPVWQASAKTKPDTAYQASQTNTNTNTKTDTLFPASPTSAKKLEFAPKESGELQVTFQSQASAPGLVTRGIQSQVSRPTAKFVDNELAAAADLFLPAEFKPTLVRAQTDSTAETSVSVSAANLKSFRGNYGPVLRTVEAAQQGVASGKFTTHGDSEFLNPRSNAPITPLPATSTEPSSSIAMTVRLPIAAVPNQLASARHQPESPRTFPVAVTSGETTSGETKSISVASPEYKVRSTTQSPARPIDTRTASVSPPIIDPLKVSMDELVQSGDSRINHSPPRFDQSKSTLHSLSPELNSANGSNEESTTLHSRTEYGFESRLPVATQQNAKSARTKSIAVGLETNIASDAIQRTGIGTELLDEYSSLDLQWTTGTPTRRDTLSFQRPERYAPAKVSISQSPIQIANNSIPAANTVSNGPENVAFKIPGMEIRGNEFDSGVATERIKKSVPGSLVGKDHRTAHKPEHDFASNYREIDEPVFNESIVAAFRDRTPVQVTNAAKPVAWALPMVATAQQPTQPNVAEQISEKKSASKSSSHFNHAELPSEQIVDSENFHLPVPPVVSPVAPSIDHHRHDNSLLNRPIPVGDTESVTVLQNPTLMPEGLSFQHPESVANLPKTTHTPNTVAAQVASQLIGAEDGWVTVSLNPADLGPLQIHVSNNADGMKIEILAQDPATLQWLEQNRDQLLEAMNQDGIGLEDLTMRQGNEQEKDARREFLKSQNENREQAFSNGQALPRGSDQSVTDFTGSIAHNSMVNIVV